MSSRFQSENWCKLLSCKQSFTSICLVGCSPDCSESVPKLLGITSPQCSGACVSLGFTLPLQTNTANIVADLGICKSGSGGERFIHGTRHLPPRKTWKDKTLLINCTSLKLFLFFNRILLICMLLLSQAELAWEDEYRAVWSQWKGEHTVGNGNRLHYFPTFWVLNWWSLAAF